MLRRSIALVALTAVLMGGAVAVSRLGGLRSPAPTVNAQMVQAYLPAAAGRTIAGLQRISVVGSTQFIVDAAGHTANVDPNPYGVLVLPPILGRAHALKGGDLLVANIGAEDKGNTVVRFPARMGPGHLFNVQPSAATLGPANLVFDTLQRTVWLTNATGNDIQIFNADGALLTTIMDPGLNHPWGLATNQGDPLWAGRSAPTFFTSNWTDGTIVRIVPWRSQGATRFRVTPVGRLPMAGAKTKIGLAWVPTAIVRGQLLTDVLLAVDPADNSLVAFPRASRQGAMPRPITVFKGMPVNLPNDLTVNPLNGDAILTNLNDNNIVEINLAQGRAVATRTVDNVPVDLQTGNGSALIGLAATTDARGGLVVYFSDDNMNTLNALST